MFKVRTDEKTEQVVELYLKDTGGGVVLLKGGHYTIAVLSDRGINLAQNIGSGRGIPVDKDGRIKVVT